MDNRKQVKWFVVSFIYYLFIDHLVFFINAITLPIIGPTPIDTILIYIIFGILFFRGLLSINLFKIRLISIILYFLITISILIGFIINRVAFDFDLIFQVIFSSFLSIFLINNLRNLDFLSEELLKISKTILIIMIIGFLLNQYAVGTIWLTNRLPFSYMMLTPILLEIWSLKRKFSVIGFVLVTISIFIMIIFGSRGPLFSLIAFVFLLFFILPKNRQRKIGLTLILIGSVILFIFIPNILSFVYDIGLNFGVESKTLLLISQENLFYDNGRFLLYEQSWLLFLESPLFGKGMFADRLFLSGNYVHNVFLEILLNFGFIFGFPLILSLIFIIFRVVTSKNKTHKELFVFFIAIGFIPLLVSGSFWVQKEFFALIAIGLICIRSKKYQEMTP